MGKIADFNKAEGYGEELDPKDPKGWPSNRILRPAFLETILLQEPYRGALTRKGVTIVGAWFTEALDLSSATLDHQLGLGDCRFESNVRLSRLKTTQVISLVGSKFTGELDMSSLKVGSSLFMRGGAEFAEVNLLGAKIGDQLSMIGSKFTGKLNMNSLEVGSSLFMRGGAEFAKAPDLIFSEVGGNLDISGSTFPTLDLTGTRVHGELRLGSDEHPATQWRKGAKLILRNAEVGALQDLPEAWPDHLELDGFTYGRLGGLGAAAESDMANRDVSWLKEWLRKQQSFSPQPYEQLAGVLRKAGQKDKADDVLYARRESERVGAKGLHKAWMFLQKIFIGYGYHNLRAVYWVGALVAIGALVLLYSGQGPAHNMPYGLSYSLDMLLPFVKLRESHYTEIVICGWAKYYFYFHKLMGYVLASFLVAGISGLTK